MPPHLANFVLLVEAGFLHVGQARLEHRTSVDPPTLGFQNAGIRITGMSHCAWPHGILGGNFSFTSRRRYLLAFGPVAAAAMLL